MDVLLNNDVETVDFGETAMRVKLTREVIEVKEINDIGSVRILMLKGEKGDVGYPTDEQVYEAVDTWLTAHPEATTTVQDNSLTWVKFNDVLKDMMFKLGITDSKSGELVSTSDAAEFPLKDLQSEITATQNLNGYDYPWVGGAGKNKFNPSEAQNNKWINSDTGEIQNANGFWVTGYIPVKSGDMVRSTAKGSARSCFYNTDKTQFSYVPYSGGTGTSITAPYDGFVVLVATQAQIPFGGEMTVTIDNEDISYAPYENICPISGRTEVNVTRTGKNLFDETGILSVGNNWQIKKATGIPLKGGQTYTFSIVVDTAPTFIYVRLLGETTAAVATATYSKSITYTPSTNTTVWVDMYWSGGTGKPSTTPNVMLELGSTATEYEPYEGDTFNTELGRTVYGGTLDLTTGELTITHAYVDLGDLNYVKDVSRQLNTFYTTLSDAKIVPYGWNNNLLCSSFKTETAAFNNYTISMFYLQRLYICDDDYSDVASFKTAMQGVQLVYELATPQTYQLTPTEVDAFFKNNTIWSDSGDVSITYLVDAKTYIDNH